MVLGTLCQKLGAEINMYVFCDFTVFYYGKASQAFVFHSLINNMNSQVPTLFGGL